MDAESFDSRHGHRHNVPHLVNLNLNLAHIGHTSFNLTRVGDEVVGARAWHFHAEHLGSLFRVFTHLGEVIRLGGEFTNVGERVFHESRVNGNNRFRALVLRGPHTKDRGSLHATGESRTGDHHRCNHFSNGRKTHNNLTDTFTMNIE